MCSIAGIVNHMPMEDFVRALEATAHRGPDGVGTWSDESVTLAHQLLALRGEVLSSAQPVLSDDGRWAMVFNGEIYNTEAICKNVLNQSPLSLDTTVLLKLIEKVGLDFPRYCDGMYAVALWDRQDKILHLLRDGSGQKPLYYHAYSNGVAFSSEIRFLLALPTISRELDVRALQFGAHVGYLFHDSTPYQLIRKLLAGERLSFSTATGKIKMERMPDFDFITEKNLSRLLSSHFQTNAEIGINLSGGMDSSALACELHEAGFRVRTFTNFFDVKGVESTYNEEALLARRLSAEYGFKHDEIRISEKDYRDVFVKAYAAVEEPDYNMGVPAYYLTAQHEGRRGQGLRMILSGDGGDEVFGGYTYYRAARRFDTYRKWMGAWVLSKSVELLRSDKPEIGYPWGLWYSAKRLETRDYFDFSLSDREVVARLKDFAVRSHIHHQSLSSGDRGCMLMDRIMFLASENFIRSDKIFMSQSIELRSPFASVALRKVFDESLNSQDLMDSEFSKIALRRSYRGRLPSYIVDRKRKWGWRPPLEYWYTPEMRELFLDLLQRHSTDGIRWDRIRERFLEIDKFPGKEMVYYLSLASILQERTGN